jgi:hypothetical protein
MARNTRKTSNPNGRKLSKTKGNKKTMKKQKGGGNIQIYEFAANGRTKEMVEVDSNSLQGIINIINKNMINFNQRILEH